MCGVWVRCQVISVWRLGVLPGNKCVAFGCVAR